MEKIRRNAPCPCGSGRKYKKCCLKKHEQACRFTAEDREVAILELQDFVEDPSWEIIQEEAYDEFCGPFLDDLLDYDNEYVQMTSEMCFDFWFFFDYRHEDGRLTADHYLESRPDLTEGERSYIIQQSKSCMRLYEVINVIPGSSVGLRDLINKSEIQIQEHTGSQTLQRWDLLAARVMPGASGRFEMEGGALFYNRMVREHLLAEIQAKIETELKGGQGSKEIDFYKTLPPLLHQAWLQPYLAPSFPSVLTPDGQEMLYLKLFFDIEDKGKLIRGLDSSEELERDGEKLSWNNKPSSARKDKYLWIAQFTIQGDRLILDTFSDDWAERGRNLVEKLAGEAVKYKISTRKSLAQAMADFDPDEYKEIETQPPELIEAASEHYNKYYREWLDDEIPALDGHSPREAARSSDLRPRLIEMLKDLEHQYQRSLKSGKPGFDPSWMWDELKLTTDPDAPGQSGDLPLTGYESLARQVPGLEKVVCEVAARFRQRPGFDDSFSISPESLDADLAFQRFLRNYQTTEYEKDHDPERATDIANLLGAHIIGLCNFELHFRKIFWVDESLAWMLAKTNTDLAGDQLRLPFTSFALVFTDRYTLGLAEKLLSGVEDCELRGQILKVITVYITREIADNDSFGLKIAFTFDALAEQWPYLVARDLYIQPESNLNDILESHFPDVKVEQLDPIFSSIWLKQLIQIVINAILYSTSSGVEPIKRQGSERKKKGIKKSKTESLLSSEDVYYLPGKIDISRLRQMQSVERAPSGRQLMHRFMVRGHWRRPNPSWKDQRPRWIQPYWKGPDIGAIIERAYRLKP